MRDAGTAVIGSAFPYLSTVKTLNAMFFVRRCVASANRQRDRGCRTPPCLPTYRIHGSYTSQSPIHFEVFNDRLNPSRSRRAVILETFVLSKNTNPKQAFSCVAFDAAYDSRTQRTLQMTYQSRRLLMRKMLHNGGAVRVSAHHLDDSSSSTRATGSC